MKFFYLGLLIMAMTENLIGDEGMWTLDNLPISRLESKYGKKLSKELIKKIQLSSVKFNDGGSGAFVSSDGLVLTNHHVAMGQLQKISSKKNNIVEKGFYARTLQEEISCPDLELNVLVDMENITEKVNSEIKNINSNLEITQKKKNLLARLEKESFEKTGFRTDTVELYSGAEYWLYRYKKFKEIKLVFAPEFQLAVFGGEKDNFQYPRFVLDIAFFRVYENGKKVHWKHYLPISKTGPKENELTIVSGHPGSTDRLKTLGEILYMKDISYPETIKLYKERLEGLREFSKKGKEEKRIALDTILSMENGLKSIVGELSGMKDPELLENLAKNEELFKQELSKLKISPKPWMEIDSVTEELKKNHKDYFYVTVSSKLPYLALSIVRFHEESKKKNGERYEEFRDSNIDSWKHRVLSSAEIYKQKEEHRLALELKILKRELGDIHEFTKAYIGNKDTNDLAKELIQNTKLDSKEYRKKLIDSEKFFEECKDPLILKMKELSPILRKKRDWLEQEIETKMIQAGSEIARLKFQVYGKETYPDATFSLRFSFGRMIGCTNHGYEYPPFTTFHGLLDRAYSFSNQKEFQLSAKTIESLDKLNLETPFNFVSTHDITGGNSGSPVINWKGEYIGIIFDGNESSHGNSFIYSEKTARAVSVHSRAILEALEKIYKTKELLKEIR
ncbi:MAG: S46 family peptidase [Leptospiraceae bacterium]|nr:S46 family peptidase [Leptospiraceae bacterium]